MGTSMNEVYHITIEEWAGDNNISVSDEQISELCEAIEIAELMSLPCGYGVWQIQTKEKSEIDFLKSQIDLLQRFIESKGYHITLFDNRIERHYMANWGERSVSAHDTFW